MYEDYEIPSMPSNQQVADALSVLSNLAMNTEGNISGDVTRLPEDHKGTRAFTFHFNFHDSRICGDSPEHARSPGEKGIVEVTIDKSKMN